MNFQELKSSKYNMIIIRDNLTDGEIFYICICLGLNKPHIDIWLFNLVHFNIELEYKELK